jgi:hypothetical protein
LTDKDEHVKKSNTYQRWNTRAVLLIAGVAALSTTLAFADDRHHRVTPPAVPDRIKVEDGNEAFLVGHATGSQNYVCLPSGTGFAWSLFTPEATLFNDDDDQIITHFFSLNPFEPGTIRATWQSSRDSSMVWAQAIKTATFTSDPQFVEQGAIAWVLLDVKNTGVQPGPTGGRRLTKTTFIQRVNTHGGSAPATGCAEAANVGSRAFIAYTADYVFYEQERDDDRDHH